MASHFQGLPCRPECRIARNATENARKQEDFICRGGRSSTRGSKVLSAKPPRCSYCQNPQRVRGKGKDEKIWEESAPTHSKSGKQISFAIQEEQETRQISNWRAHRTALSTCNS